MKHSTLRRVILSGIALSLLPFSAACSPANSSESRRAPVPKLILDGTVDDSVAEHEYLDFYTITSSTVEDISGYAVALKANAKPDKITIPAKWPNTDSGTPVVGVMPYGFREATATELEFKGEIEIIDYEAFFGSAITSVNIPWSIKKIGDSAFYNCGSLQKVTFNSTNKTSKGSATSCPTCEEGEEGCEVDPGTDVTDAQLCTLTNIPAFCFFNCRSLTTLTLPASLEEVEYEAFNGCSSLASTLFFQSIKIIRARAFQSCTALRAVYIPNSFFSYVNGPGIEPLAFNLCDPTLIFNFSTSTATYNTWKNNNHSEWGWRNETGSTKEYYQPNITGAADVYFDTDWQYKVDADGAATITAYTGATPTKGFLVLPNILGVYTVRRIDANALSTVKGIISRLYLPTTLYAIENYMFDDSYTNLTVIDSNDHCNLDWDSEHDTSVASPTKRIDLSHLVELQFIGVWAFCKMKNRKTIEMLHLPANLIAIGNEAFCCFEGRGHMDGVKEFLWDFDENTSRLQVIGTDAFYKLGVAGMDNQNYGNDQYNSKIKPATIVFPKTFKYFGMIQADVNEYKTKQNGHIAFTFVLKPSGSGGDKVKYQRPAHCFGNCPLIGTVVFKGSAKDAPNPDPTTSDLIVPNQTFIYNENLQRIIFEERYGHFISFHTQAAYYGQQCIGSNGVGKDSYRGRPFLQTIVLPTKYTNLRIQRLAFQGNPRAAMYLSGSYGNDGTDQDSGMYYDDHDNYNSDMSKYYAWTDLIFNKKIQLENATQWRTIGDESFLQTGGEKKYFGFCFAASEKAETKTADLNKFYLNQKIPYYENVHYEATFTVKAYVVDDSGVGRDQTSSIHVEVGEKTGDYLEYVEDNDCVYLCGGTDTVGGETVNKAVMTKYLYRLWPNGDDAEPRVNRDIKTVTVKKNLTVGGKTYTVTEIGASAFSAAHCNEALKDNATNQNNQGSTNDLEHVKLPNTIKKIGEYAFFRAYNLQKVSAYDSNPDSLPESGYYIMPSNLEYVGKNAFSFCGIQQVLNIPDDCLFYENDDKVNNHADYEVTSVFTNSFSLRKITFKHGNTANSAESNKYITSTYSDSAYTTALYSKNTTDNPNRLLIILNRDAANYNTASKTGSTLQDFVKKNQADSYPTFSVPSDSAYAGNPFLYGAYKMAYWLKYADIGHCTTSTGSVATQRSEILNQPLFSGICKRDNKDQAESIYRIYLGMTTQQYPNVACDLRKASGKMFSMPLYGFNGCENLTQIGLPNEPNGVLPEGLFANTGNVKYTTESHTTADGNLDLTGTGYSGVGKETFLNNKGITSVTTPGSGAFTIGESAFSGCTNITSVTIPNGTTNITFNKNSFYGCSKLTTLDLSNVSGKVTFNEGCFENSKITTINWPASAEITIGKNAFKNCDSLQTLTLPANTKSLGEGCFQDCDSLQSVSFAGANTAITTIGASAFNSCDNLNSFDFANLTNLTTINGSAFASAGTIVTNGIISFGSKITTFGASAFSGSKLTQVTFNCSTISLGESAFASIGTLTKVRFTDHDCVWSAYNGSVFKNCSALTDLQLPTKFSLTTTGAADMILGDSNVRLFTYNTFNSQSPTGDWRKFDSTAGTQKDVVYFVSKLADLSAATAGGDTLFWALDANGDAIYLGTLVSKDASLAVFSEGYQADSSGVTPTA